MKSVSEVYRHGQNKKKIIRDRNVRRRQNNDRVWW